MRTPGSLESMLYPIRKRWYIIVICVLLAGIAATRYLYMATPHYQATATLRIEDAQDGMAGSNLYRDFDVFKANAKIQTEVEVLKSRSLFEKALDQLDFYVEYYRPGELKKEEVYHEAPVKVDFTITDSKFRTLTCDFRHTSGNKYSLTYDAAGTLVQKEGEFGKPLCDRGVCITIRRDEEIMKYHAGRMGEPWTFTLYSREALTAKLMNTQYLVKAVDKDVNIVKLYYTHPVPEKASLLVNAIAEAYINQGIEDKKTLAGSTVDFINQQIAIVGRELEAARDAIKSYRIKNEIVNIPQETEATYKTLGELEIQRVDLNMQLSVLENMSDYLRRNKEIKFSGPEYGTVIDQLFSESVSRLNAKMRERDDLLRKFTAENDRVKNVDAEIAQQKAYLVESINNTRRKLLFKQDELYLAIDEQKASFKGLPEKESTLQELNRNYFLFEKVYNFLIEKRTEAIITRQVNVSFNRVLESATVPTEPVAPRRDVIWGVALLLGLISGVMLAYFRHFSKPSVSTPEDLNTETSGIPVIGQVQQFRKNETAYKAFTALSTRIFMNNPDQRSMVITVTSTRKGEGKSFVSAQLARTLAAQDKKVILLDLNTYSPRLGEWFDARTGNGIKEVYTHQCSLQDAIQLTSIPNLDVITAGEAEQPVGHLVATHRTREIIEELRGQYDAVIIDTPEVGEHIEAIPYMKWSDLNLYVVRAESGRDELVANAEMVKEEYRLQEVYYVLNGMKERRNHTGYIAPARNKKLSNKKNTPRLTNLFMW
ncbi:MAG: AAA family ATPase [Bacteroidia bacterium]|nr:AAA family ATPase [Bacteroidia bacterium]